MNRDYWDGRTLEWSIPNPPPEYNFAQIPEVTSRYPLWDLKDPKMTAGIDHSHADAMTITDAHAVPVHEETQRHTAKELGIPMPLPTAKPLFVAFTMVVMFCGLLFLRNDMFAVAMTVMLGGAAAMIAGLCANASPAVAQSTKYPRCSFDMRLLSAQFASTFWGGVSCADCLPADLV